jgi:hypothetical protein
MNFNPWKKGPGEGRNTKRWHFWNYNGFTTYKNTEMSLKGE